MYVKIFGALVAPFPHVRTCYTNSECGPNECCIFPNRFIASRRRRGLLPLDVNRGECRRKSKLRETCLNVYTCGCEDGLRCVPDSWKRGMMLPQHCEQA
ncbi:uncharacterized protein LOC121378327 isoform X2 [Gigantopelta aegis]|uniref:uncharacterized protein LOC121378327 isoform X2 n=1 Tax=Gigantopelta aegis TaxID=1735272 RepID=UPI001B88AAA4|nr:uncharacterized protein LOC121378327 isoform X2 [Gigantopelta aegis]